MKPFLFQYAKRAGSPPESELGTDYYFNPEDDLLHKKDNDEDLPAIEIENEDGPKTKKNDVEKGDDNKDSGIWM